MTPKKELSLLPDEVNVGSFTARAIRWVSTVGRFVIVFTELLVIGAFLSRFWLDRKNSDLSETLRQQKAILESTKDFEKEYTLLQNRLKVIKSTVEGQQDYVKRIDSLTQTIPPNVIFNSMDLSQNDDGRIYVQVNAVALDENSLVDFITNLLLNQDLATVDIQTIEKKAKENNYNATLQLIFKVDAAAKANEKSRT